jgi:hypothetical protein
VKRTLIKLVLVVVLSAGAIGWRLNTVQHDAEKDVACEVHGTYEGRLCTTGG